MTEEHIGSSAWTAPPLDLRPGDTFSATEELNLDTGERTLKQFTVTRGGIDPTRPLPPSEPTTPGDDVLNEFAIAIEHAELIEHGEQWLRDRGWSLTHVKHDYPDRWDYTYNPAGAKSCRVCGHTIYD